MFSVRMSVMVQLLLLGNVFPTTDNEMSQNEKDMS